MGINSKLNCEGKITAGSAITVDTVNAWQHITNIVAGELCNGLDVVDGIVKSITAFADGGGGQVVVTAAGHTFPEDHYISITGTTNYNGLYQVTSTATDTFEITETWVSDDATGTARHGSHTTILPGQGGDYIYVATLSATSAAANNTFEFTFLLNNDVNGLTRRKFSTSTDVGSMSMLGFFHAEPGDQISVALRNITSAANVTVEEAQFAIFKVS